MRIAVTGSSGRIGRYVVRELINAGHEVVGLDVQSQPGSMRVDLTDAGQIYGALAGAAAVVHMGAWPNPGLVPDTRTYADNTTGTFNVFQACADLGIRRIVSASSNQVYGFAGAPPLYAPVDEEHPCRPVNCYALSKMAGEQAADYFCKNKGLKILSFRILGTRTPAEIPDDIAKIAADPQSGGRLLWTRTDARDVARACRLAVEATEVESGVYNIAGPRVGLDMPTRKLVARYFGDCTEVRDGLEDFASPLSCAKARRVFAYAPRYAWSVSSEHPENGAS
ncbi:MAG: NAD(P)-dependent oxidoreductase [Candidatus Latescibacterota bacterium]|nr:NAD(P)-dependent oxidoreductase [Candidatus Latescibacterota bacterium]